MKYAVIIFVAILAIGFAYFKGYSVAASDNTEAISPCAPESILASENPDARYSHCLDQDWDRATLLRDRLAEVKEKPQVYQIVCRSPDPSLILPEEIMPPGFNRFPNQPPIALEPK